jgi:hypothetical protein
VVVAEDGGQQRRDQHEDGQLRRADLLGTLERAAAPEQVHRRDGDQEDAEPAQQRQQLVEALPLLVEGEGQLGQEDEDQERGGPGPHVGRRPVLVDEVREAAAGEPALGATREVVPGQVVHLGESGP